MLDAGLECSPARSPADPPSHSITAAARPFPLAAPLLAINGAPRRRRCDKQARPRTCPSCPALPNPSSLALPPIRADPGPLLARQSAPRCRSTPLHTPSTIAACHWCAELELAPPPHSRLHRAPNHHHTALLKPHSPASSLLHRRGAAAAAQSRRRPPAPAEHPFPAPFLSNQPRSHLYLTAEKLTGPLLCPLRPPELA